MAKGFTRRAFIGSATALTAGTYISWRYGSDLFAKAKGSYLVGEIFFGPMQKREGFFSILSDQAQLIARWPVPLMAHSVWQNQARPWQVAGIEKKGTIAGFIDVRHDGPPTIIQAPTDMQFYGHGFFSQDGTHVFLSAHELPSYKGFALIYDSISFKLLDKIESGGHKPHDLQIDRQHPDRFLIANFGDQKHPSNVSWISLRDGKILDQLELSHPKRSVAHFNQELDGAILFTGGTREYETVENEEISFGYYQRDSQKIQIVSENWGKHFFGESLNSFIDHKNARLWISLPESNRVLVVDQKSFQILEEFENIKNARSIFEFNDGGKRKLSVSYRNQYEQGSQMVFDIDSMELSSGTTIIPERFYSIHTMPFKNDVKIKG